MNPFLRKKPRAITNRQQRRLDKLARIRRRWWDNAELSGEPLICGICHKPIKHFWELDSDHRIPGKMGGCRNDAETNLQPAHRACNVDKGSKRGEVVKVKRRAGKIMKIKDAKEYWSGKVCFCDGEKRAAESFCAECRTKLSAQTLYDLEHCDNPDDYRQALAQAEIEILQWKAVSE